MILYDVEKMVLSDTNQNDEEVSVHKNGKRNKTQKQYETKQN